MRGLSGKSILMGFGLGLVCASLFFLIFFNSRTGINPATQNLSGAGQTSASGKLYASVDNKSGRDSLTFPKLGAERVILLDGDTPRALSAAEVAALNDEIAALDVPQPSSGAATTAAAGATVAGAVAASTTKAATASTTAAAAEAASTTAAIVTVSASTTATIAETTTTTVAAASTTTTEAATTTTAEAASTTTTEAATTATTAAASTTTTAAATTTAPPATTATPTAPSGPTATLTVVRGDTATGVSKKLLDLGLISNQSDFLERLQELRLTGELLDGTFVLQLDLDLDTLIDKITVHK